MITQSPLDALISAAKTGRISPDQIKAAEDEVSRIRLMHYSNLSEAASLLSENRKLHEQIALYKSTTVNSAVDSAKNT